MNQDIIERNKEIFKEIEKKYNCDIMKSRSYSDDGENKISNPNMESLLKQLEVVGNERKFDYAIGIYFLTYNKDFGGLEVLRYNVENPYYES